MVEIHGENPNLDYMLKFDKIIDDKPINPLKSHEVYLHKDLHELFVEEEMPEYDFKFIATDKDGNTTLYLFNIDKWNYFLQEERRDNCIDMISTINGSIEWMIELGLAKCLKNP